MSSVIDVRVLGDDGEQLSHMRFTVEYGNEEQKVLLILDGGRLATEDEDSFLSLNEMMVDNAMARRDNGGYDA